jgi:hypothetical protein
VRGSTQFAGRFFEIEEPKDRCYHNDKDLLEGQTSWDAFLLKHFINTHLRRAEAAGSEPAERWATILKVVEEAQDSYLGWAGWVRRHNASTARVIQLIKQGLLWEAFGGLVELVKITMDEREMRLVAARMQEDRMKRQAALEAEVRAVDGAIEAEVVGDGGNDGRGDPTPKAS